MICPECGVGMIEWEHGWLCSNPHCLHDIVDEEITKKYIKKYEIDYQQRLDKVLSKFDLVDSGYYWINLFSGIDITYNRFNKSEFHLWNVMEVGQMRNAYKKIKTLKTVESLLEDLVVK